MFVIMLYMPAQTATPMWMRKRPNKSPEVDWQMSLKRVCWLRTAESSTFPTAMVYEDGVTTITYVKADSSTQTTAGSDSRVFYRLPVGSSAGNAHNRRAYWLQRLTETPLPIPPRPSAQVRIVTAVATDPDAIITIRNGTAVVPNGTAATWAVGRANVVTITVKNGEADNVYTVTVTKTLSDTLESLVLGELTLSPDIRFRNHNYTAETTDESNVITAVATGPEATIAIMHGETPVENGTAATWTVGANVVTITVNEWRGRKCLYSYRHKDTV